MKYLLSVLLVVALVACGENKNEESDNSSGVKKEVAEETTQVIGPKRLLKYNFKVGEVVKYKLTTEMQNSQIISADTTISTQVNQWTQYQLKIKVDKIADNDIAEISVTVNGIKAKLDANGQKMEYDSKFIYSTREKMAYVEYEALKNKTFKIKVAANGEILDITGVEAIINEVINIQGNKEKITSEQKKMFVQQYTAATLAPLTEQIFRKTSKDNVGVNSFWEQKYPSYLAGFEIENIARFKVVDFAVEGKDTLAKLDASLSIKWKGKNHVTQEGVTYNFSDPNVSGSGVIYFNVVKGFVQRSETSVKMEMQMTMDGLDANQKPIKAAKKDYMMNKSKLELI